MRNSIEFNEFQFSMAEASELNNWQFNQLAVFIF